MKIAEIFKVAIDPKRVYGLDIIRGAGILTVLYGHSRHLIGPYINERFYMAFVLDVMSMFFVLSGFLIGGILLKVINKTDFERKDLVGFWIRRWYRTLPNYYLILVIIFVLTYLLKGFVPIPHFFVFLQNFYKTVPANFFFPEAWSISIEEWFYLINPFILFLALRIFKDHKKQVFFWMIIFVLVSVTGIRTYMAYHLNCIDDECWRNNIRQLVITRLDTMMFGFLGAYISYYHPGKWTANLSGRFYLGVVLVLVPQLYDYTVGGMFFENYLSLSFASLGTLLILPILTSIKTGNGFLYKWITIFSLISYSLYLLHYSIIQDLLLTVIPNKLGIFNDPGPLVSFSKLALFWVLSVCFSILLYKYYEVPMTNLRDRRKVSDK